MKEFLRWRYGATLVAVAAFVVACSEATNNPVAPDAGKRIGSPRGVVVQDDVGQCMGDDDVDFPANVSG